MADTQKTTATEKTAAPTPPQRYKGWDMSRVFWGLLLVLIGVLFLLSNFGVIELHYENLWYLWPLLIVGWGVSLLNIRGTWWKFVSAILMLASLALLAWVAIGTAPFIETVNNAQVQSRQVEKAGGTVKSLDVSVKAGAGKVLIGSQASTTPVDAVLRSNFAKLDVNSQNEGDVQKVDVSVNGEHVWWGGGFQNELNVQLARQLPVSLKVETGASDLNADLSEVMLEHLSLDLGASNSVVTLGSLANSLDVSLKAGASSVTMRVPKNSGVSVKLDNGVSSQHLADLKDKGGGYYETDGFDAASKKITISGDIGVTSFKLERY